MDTSSANAFPNALLFVLRNEGGFVDNPLDHGGPTNRGITLSTMTQWRKLQNRPVPTVDDIRNLSVAETGDIYKALFWSPNNLNAINSSVISTVLFDIGVLNGPTTAAAASQIVASAISGQTLTADGKLGPRTAAAINACPPARFVRLLQRREAKRYLSIVQNDATQAVFFDSWMARTFAYSDLFLTSAPAAN